MDTRSCVTKTKDSSVKRPNDNPASKTHKGKAYMKYKTVFTSSIVLFKFEMFVSQLSHFMKFPERMFSHSRKCITFSRFVQ